MQQLAAERVQLKLRQPPAASCVHAKVKLLYFQRRILYKAVVAQCDRYCIV
jgi:hypothetical protein